MSAKTEGNAAYLRRIRQEAVELGKCYVCRCRPVKSGSRYCVECFDRGKAYKTKIKYRRCQRCGADVTRRKRLVCARCASVDHAGDKARSERAVAEGRCSRCKTNPLAPGRRQCVTCLDECATRQLARGRLAGRKATSKCRLCKALGIESTGHDHRSHERWMAKRKEWL